MVTTMGAWDTIKEMFRTSGDRLCLNFGFRLVGLGFVDPIDLVALRPREERNRQ